MLAEARSTGWQRRFRDWQRGGRGQQLLETEIILVILKSRVLDTCDWPIERDQKSFAELANIGKTLLLALGHRSRNKRAQFRGNRGIGIARVRNRRVQLHLNYLDIVGIVIGQFAS